jgi:hypothetical protein
MPSANETAHQPTSTRDVSPKTQDQKLPENEKDVLDDKLDHALEETFPTSDPVSVKITK